MLEPENIIEDAVVEPVSAEQETESTDTEEQKEENVPSIQPIALVVSSRRTQEENAEFIRQVQLMALFPIHVYFTKNDGYSLTAVYNQVLNNDVKENRVVFMHDDAEFISAGWARTLWRLFENNPEYGIIGVAGSKDFDEDGAWWVYKNKYGAVIHRKDVQDKEGNKGFLTFRTKYSEPIEQDLEEVCVIDGVFIAIDRTRIKKQFDTEMTGFNFYDINLCLDNFITKEVKIGVTSKIRIQHKGLGVIRPEWFVNRAKTLEKFANILPISNLQCNTPTEGKTDVPAFKPENDPWKKGEIKIVTPEEAEKMRKEQEAQILAQKEQAEQNAEAEAGPEENNQTEEQQA